MGNRILVVLVISFAFFSVSGCVRPYGINRGQVVDAASGQPLENVIIVRSWDQVSASVAGTLSGLDKAKEAVSNKNGEFVFFPGLLVALDIPLFTWFEQNKYLVFKPGYDLLRIDQLPPVIRMPQTPNSYYAAFEEIRKTEDVFLSDFDLTPKLGKAVKQYRARIDDLPKYVPGVWFTGFTNPEDIAIDQENNVFVVDCAILKLSQETKEAEKKRIGSCDKTDIEIDRNGNLYSFEGRKLYYHNRGVLLKGLPGGDARFTLGPEEKVYVIVPSTLIHYYDPLLFCYDLEGNLLYKQEAVTQKDDPQIDRVSLIDVASTPDNHILVAYYPVWDNSLSKYVSRSRVLAFDQNGKPVLNKQIDIDTIIESIAVTADGLVVVADKTSIYVYKDSNLLFNADMRGEGLLGEVRIQRIACDKSGTYLYVTDAKFSRILKYNLKTREFCAR